MTKSVNIIQRRELDPLLLKAREVIKHYEQAADCVVSVLGPDCRPVEDSAHPKTMRFCALCKRYHRGAGKILEKDEYPCTAMHVNSVWESRRLGGSYIYVCPAGFIFWTSPIYSGERFAGALQSRGVIGPDRRQAAENIFRICGGEVPRREIARYLEDIPKKNNAEIKALAQMMLVCAEQISGAAEQIAGGGEEAGAEPVSREKTPAPESRRNNANAYPLDKERKLMASLRRGDHDEARNILKELLDALYASGGDSFEMFQLRAIELAVLLSRAAAGGEDSENGKILETNNRYLKKIEEAQSTGEIFDILSIILDRISGKLFSFQGIRHSLALRKAERFIWENYTRKISLREIATASGLSAPYFSTIFKDEMGENLSNYLNRLRVEKASAMLTETDLPISGIAAACGFEDQSWFSKIFKNYTGVSPGRYRERGCV
jgi:AraC-like DNA-binding protein/ligand-binding sensor protein